ncbi:MAG: hypothetical protein LBP73_04555 [Clostridiales Family XIII bacterium]|jgi:FtsZ-interacting cell division protein ZipA|nr:hypothetical protein [Clostridiales Family XIII bacterium]
MGILPGEHQVDEQIMEALKLFEIFVICALIALVAVAVICLLLWRRKRRRGARKSREDQGAAKTAVCENTEELSAPDNDFGTIVVEKEIVFVHTDEVIE